MAADCCGSGAGICPVPTTSQPWRAGAAALEAPPASPPCPVPAVHSGQEASGEQEWGWRSAHALATAPRLLLLCEHIHIPTSQRSRRCGENQGEVPEKTGMETQLDAGRDFPLAERGQFFISPRHRQRGRVTVPRCINSHRGSEKIMQRTVQ